MNIDAFIRELSGALNMPAPTIEYNEKLLETPTTLAACSSDGKSIAIRPQKENSPDLYFAIAHELRHSWQIRIDSGRLLKGYRASRELGTRDYNMQPAEIDAHAFAAIVMKDVFGLKVLFNNLPEAVREAVAARILEIVEEFKKNGKKKRGGFPLSFKLKCVMFPFSALLNI